MNPHPKLIIFDIDSTLVRPAEYYTTAEISAGMYDTGVMTYFLASKNHQVAIASFNQDIHNGAAPYGGKRFGRLILDIQHPTGDSAACVEDDFIQAWRYPTMQQLILYGKNDHIKLIIEAYNRKYRRPPAEITLYDDCIENVYLANRIGVTAWWVVGGLRRDNILRLPRISDRFTFTITEGDIGECIQRSPILYQMTPYIYRYPNACCLYLPSDGSTGWKETLIVAMSTCGVKFVPREK
jgi:hypothetical protein